MMLLLFAIVCVVFLSLQWFRHRMIEIDLVGSSDSVLRSEMLLPGDIVLEASTRRFPESIQDTVMLVVSGITRSPYYHAWVVLDDHSMVHFVPQNFEVPLQPIFPGNVHLQQGSIQTYLNRTREWLPVYKVYRRSQPFHFQRFLEKTPEVTRTFTTLVSWDSFLWDRHDRFSHCNAFVGDLLITAGLLPPDVLKDKNRNFVFTPSSLQHRYLIQAGYRIHGTFRGPPRSIS